MGIPPSARNGKRHRKGVSFSFVDGGIRTLDKLREPRTTRIKQEKPQTRVRVLYFTKNDKKIQENDMFSNLKYVNVDYGRVDITYRLCNEEVIYEVLCEL